MSTNIKNGHSNRLIYSIFELYRSAGISSNASDRAIRDAARKAVLELSKADKEYIQQVSFELHPDMFEITDPTISRFDLFVGFSNFCKSLYNLISGSKSEYADLKPVVRKALPDLKAFEFIGTNDLKISYQPSDYTLVYGA